LRSFSTVLPLLLFEERAGERRGGAVISAGSAKDF
jgi:hypothetical protein